MPSASLHLTLAEILAQESALPEPLQRAMLRELTYARLGSIIHDLPFYTNIVTMMLGYWLEMPAETCPFAVKLHRYHPDLFAWHVLGETRKDSALTPDQRLAFLGGFFSHMALDLELHPLVNWCARRELILHGGHESHHHRLTEKYQSLFFHRELRGRDVIGTSRFFTEKSRIVEDPAFFRVNTEMPVVRWVTDLAAGFFHEAAPTMRQFAAWVRSFRHFGFMVSLPPAHRNSQRLGTRANRERYYENDDFSFIAFWDRGYQRAIRLLTLAYQAHTADDSSLVAREAFLEEAGLRGVDLSYPREKGFPALPQYQEPVLQLAI